MGRTTHAPTRSVLLGLAALALAGALGCGAPRALSPTMEPLPIGGAGAPAVLTQDHFRRDGAGSISEEDLRRVLDAPVFLRERARLGVLPVATRYEPDPDLPLTPVPDTLTQALQDSGLFDVATEVTTDWPSDRSISGLREMAARYRVEYLLLYRQRFVDRSYTNAWALMWPTIIGIFVVPSQTLETAGIVEATLFEVRTGTLLFTVFERVRALSDENVWHNERKRRAMKARLLEKAADQLAARVVDKSRRLDAARPAPAGAPVAPAIEPPERRAPSPAALPAGAPSSVKEAHATAVDPAS